MTLPADRLRRRAAERRQYAAALAWVEAHRAPEEDTSRTALVDRAIHGEPSGDPKTNALAHLTGG